MSVSGNFNLLFSSKLTIPPPTTATNERASERASKQNGLDHRSLFTHHSSPKCHTNSNNNVQLFLVLARKLPDLRGCVVLDSTGVACELSLVEPSEPAAPPSPSSKPFTFHRIQSRFVIPFLFNNFFCCRFVLASSTTDHIRRSTQHRAVLHWSGVEREPEGRKKDPRTSGISTVWEQEQHDDRCYAIKTDPSLARPRPTQRSPHPRSRAQIGSSKKRCCPNRSEICCPAAPIDPSGLVKRQRRRAEETISTTPQLLSFMLRTGSRCAHESTTPRLTVSNVSSSSQSQCQSRRPRSFLRPTCLPACLLARPGVPPTRRTACWASCPSTCPSRFPQDSHVHSQTRAPWSQSSA